MSDDEIRLISCIMSLALCASILWAQVPGALARVVAYDADGDVVDDHTLRACSGGVDCEVR